MSDYLDRLVARTQGEMPVLKPRNRSHFEPSEPSLTETPTETPASSEGSLDEEFLASEQRQPVTAGQPVRRPTLRKPKPGQTYITGPFGGRDFLEERPLAKVLEPAWSRTSGTSENRGEAIEVEPARPPVTGLTSAAAQQHLEAQQVATADVPGAPPGRDRSTTTPVTGLEPKSEPALVSQPPSPPNNALPDERLKASPKPLRLQPRRSERELGRTAIQPKADATPGGFDSILGDLLPRSEMVVPEAQQPAATQEKVVRVKIGRVDVRVIRTPTVHGPRQSTPAGPKLVLSEYLRGRNEARRR